MLKIIVELFTNYTCTSIRVPRFDFLLEHCVKSVHIQKFSGPYSPIFGLNTEKC